jgi:hypothetical protein
MCMCVVWLCMGYHAKGNTGSGGSSVVRALKLGSKWSQVGGGKKLQHIHTPRPRARSEGLLFVCFFVCQLVGCGIEEK